jgi:hypothetical protein
VGQSDDVVDQVIKIMGLLQVTDLRKPSPGSLPLWRSLILDPCHYGKGISICTIYLDVRSAVVHVCCVYVI